jgi:hypothetical protein
MSSKKAISIKVADKYVKRLVRVVGSFLFVHADETSGSE